ncbi:hypothetical protein [Photobacterium damselae]|uniref:hypothetical protein n=1 Tax=Photobacterium damselae TaxID=38293 RepID=UPI001F32A297|nr:hypothetical protein [Photobacterium damselae]UKA09161.1 hypothetical protein IHC91_08980 [Photobacterium damselae subsp. damselae]
MASISSKEFWNAWKNVVLKRHDEICANWCDNPSYTKMIISNENSVVMDVAKELSIHCFNGDYYSTDSVFYSDDDIIPEVNGVWLRDMRIAFEHENSFNSGLYQEVAHLLLLNSDLKVLVTYPYDNDEELESKELDYLHGVISGNRHANLISDTESFLIIFGYGEEMPRKWLGLIFKKDDWKPIGLFDI